jgi:hypothetical protein
MFVNQLIVLGYLSSQLILDTLGYFFGYPNLFLPFFLLPCDCLSKPLAVHLSLSTTGLGNSLFYLSFLVVFPRVVVALCCGKAQFCTFLAP